MSFSIILPPICNGSFSAILQFRLTNSQRYLVVGLVGSVGLVGQVGLVGLVGLVLWLVSGLALTKYHCEFFVNLNCKIGSFSFSFTLPGLI